MRRSLSRCHRSATARFSGNFFTSTVDCPHLSAGLVRWGWLNTRSSMSTAVETSIIVPTYCERENIAPLAERIFAHVSPQTTELIIVDDDSPDGTAAAVATLADRYPIRCLRRVGERGLATAVVAGLREARGALCVVMDADLSHPPEAIPKLLEVMRDPAVEMCIGSRFVPGASVDLHWPLRRRVISRIGRWLAWPLCGHVRDVVSGFFCVRRSLLDLDTLRPVGYKIALELIVRHRWRRVVEIPIRFQDRQAGVTKLSLAEQGRYLRHIGRLYVGRLLGR